MNSMKLRRVNQLVTHQAKTAATQTTEEASLTKLNFFCGLGWETTPFSPKGRNPTTKCCKALFSMKTRIMLKS